MGFWSNVGAAMTTNNAVAYVENSLKAHELPGDTQKLAHHLVMDLWASIPALADQSAKPTKAVLVAAAALANGIRYFDAHDKRYLADKLFPCLNTLLTTAVRKQVDLSRLSSIDSQLLEIAHSVFDKPKTAVSNELTDLLRGNT